MASGKDMAMAAIAAGTLLRGMAVADVADDIREQAFEGFAYRWNTARMESAQDEAMDKLVERQERRNSGG